MHLKLSSSTRILLGLTSAVVCFQLTYPLRALLDIRQDKYTIKSSASNTAPSLYNIFWSLSKGPLRVEEECAGYRQKDTQRSVPSKQTSTIDEENKENAWNAWKNSPLFQQECFLVEDVCHSATRWFYTLPETHSVQQPTSENDQNDGDRGDSRTNEPKKQPIVLFHKESGESIDQDWQGKSGYPDDLYIEYYHANLTRQLNCVQDPVRNHVILFNSFSHMLGEFYERGLLTMWRIFTGMMNDDEAEENNNNQLLHHLLSDMQLYVHLEDPRTQSHLMDSHHLFSSLLRTRPILDFRTLLFETNCQCMTRLIFCGYSVTSKLMQEYSAESKEDQPTASRMRRRGNADHTAAAPEQETLDVEGAGSMLSKARTNYDKENENPYGNEVADHNDIGEHRRGDIDEESTTRIVDGDDKSSGLLHQIMKTMYELTPVGPQLSIQKHDHAKLRFALRRHAILNNPFVRADIDDFRYMLFSTHVDAWEQRTDHGHWKIVGLAQRSLRRRWDNLETVHQVLSQSLYQNCVLLLVVNVENEDWNPYTQLVRHAALDALIGIHGAQMTEAIWMKPGSLVVELLPYIPKGLHGSWVKTTHKPTPLGIIFDETDLNHVGYPLERDSAPYCHENETSTLSKDRRQCWRETENRWDVRNFLVSPQTVERIIRKFIVEELTLCSDFVEKAGDEIVLYNVNCKESVDKPKRPRHYYWKRGSNKEVKKSPNEIKICLRR